MQLEKRQYHGPHSEGVSVEVPGHPPVSTDKAGIVEVPRAVALLLDEQPDIWKPVAGQVKATPVAQPSRPVLTPSED